MKTNRKVRVIGQGDLRTGVAEVEIKPLVRIGKIGRSKLASQTEVEQAREGVGELAPELVKHYGDIAGVLADPERIAWDATGLVAEFAAVAEAVLGTGSSEKDASATAQRAREVVVLAAGQAMTAFPKTVTALVYLANHAIEIGLLRRLRLDEKGFCVELPIGDPIRPNWVKLLCPLPKSAQLVADYLAMSTEAKQKDQSERGDKVAKLEPLSRTFLEVFEKGDGETVCYVPRNRRYEGSQAMLLKITIDNGFITVIDSAGDPLGNTFVDFWIPLVSVQENRFRNKVIADLDGEQIRIMNMIRNRIREGWLCACNARNRQKVKETTVVAPSEPVEVTNNELAAAE